MSKSIQQFNFNEWYRLAIDDPAAFESRRREVIDGMIDSLPQARQQRLRRLQWRIDQERNRSKTPMGACIRLSRMMWDSVLGESGFLETIQGVKAGNKPPKPRQSATIVRFPSLH